MIREPLKSYSDFATVYEGRRAPPNGERKLKQNWKLIKEDDTFSVVFEPWRGRPLTKVLTVAPDNTLTFTLTAEQFNFNKQSMAQMIPKIIPLFTRRRAVGVYGVCRLDGRWQVTPICELFEGLQIDLVSLNAKNPRPNLTSKENINPEARRKWLRTRRTFIRQMVAREKMGVVDAVLEGNKKPLGYIPHAHKVDRIFEMMSKGDITEEDIISVASMFWRSYYWMEPSSPVQQLVTFINGGGSLPLRKKFGVFINE